MHNSTCPKCGVSFDGDTKKCGACGAVSRLSAPCSFLLPSYPYLSLIQIHLDSCHLDIYLCPSPSPLSPCLIIPLSTH
ncbi:hypothetical protein GGS26DRAFT_552651 [Hypomontagnella submonticulosa]|nr:hypothetical protein GGS26DRAFT_552651 [Hypomontagnella submonticulosa]